MSQVVLSYMVKINQYKQLILYVLITNSVIHALCGLNLIIGGLLSPTYKQRLLFLPWLTLDMIYIVLTTIVFVSWAFLSFFVHILVAIFFPVVSGAFLGKIQYPNPTVWNCGNFMIFLSLRFYGKSILGIVKVQNLPF